MGLRREKLRVKVRSHLQHQPHEATPNVMRNASLGGGTLHVGLQYKEPYDERLPWREISYVARHNTGCLRCFITILQSS